MEDLSGAIRVIEIVNAGGVIAILVLLVMGFFSGTILSRKVHDEMNEKQQIVIDSTIKKIDEGFKGQTEVLHDIKDELKKLNGG